MSFNYSPKIVTDNLVLYLDAANTRSYPTTGTTWTDLSKFNNGGTLINGTTFNSNYGGTILFDGTNDYLITADNQSPSLNITSQITLESWISPGAIANISHSDAIFSKGFSSDGNSGTYEMLILPSGGINYPLFRVRVGSSTPTYFPTNIPLNINQNYHYVSTFNGSILRIFINGVESGSGLSSVGSIEANTQQLTIGVRYAQRGGIDSFYTGSIYSCRIYNRALTQQEVLQNFNTTKSRYGL
jgi:hypothetical protein